LKSADWVKLEPAMPLSVEEALKRIEDQAAMVRALADYAATSDVTMEKSALSGMADSCGRIERLARDTRRTLTADALCVELKRGKKGLDMTKDRTKPCTHEGCTGTMTYHLDAVRGPEQGVGIGDEHGNIAWQPGTRPGWACDKNPAHAEPENRN
jgi:hypothetical protein